MKSKINFLFQGCPELIDPFVAHPKPWSAKRISEYGVTEMTIVNGTHIRFKQRNTYFVSDICHKVKQNFKQTLFYRMEQFRIFLRLSRVIGESMKINLKGFPIEFFQTTNLTVKCQSTFLNSPISNKILIFQLITKMNKLFLKNRSFDWCRFKTFATDGATFSDQRIGLPFRNTVR